MLLLFLIAFVILIAIVLAFVIRTVILSVRKHKKEKENRERLERIRQLRKSVHQFLTTPSPSREPAYRILFGNPIDEPNLFIQKDLARLKRILMSTRRRHQKNYKLAYTCIDKYELPTIVGVKRLVDKSSDTKVLSNLYESNKWENHNESHYQCKQYKFDNRKARREKRAMRERYYRYLSEC